MITTKKFFVIGFIIILGLSACNLPSQLSGTATAEAATAASATALVLASTTAAPGITEIPSSTPFPTDTPSITPTSTSSIPMVTVSVNTNCRTGPGVVYDLNGALLVGEEAVVVGKFTSGNYWIINNPDASGTCWLWGQYATVTGNTAGLPEYTPPPTPTPTYTPTPTATPTKSPPSAPDNFVANKNCVPVGPQFLYQFILQWDDKANNEDGYRIYSNGGLVTTLPANSITYVYVIGQLPPGVAFTLEVEAYNGTGASGKKSTVATCP